MVLVKMKGMDKPILLSRNYLPEFKDWDASEFERSVQKPKPYSDKMEGRNQLRDYQNKRIYDYCKQIGEITFNENKYVCIDGSTFSTLEEVCLYTCLFDGNPDTYWASERRDNVYFVEFYLENPLHVTSYSLTTSSYSFGSNDFNPKHNPKSWKLYAKKSRDGEGFLLDQRSNEQLPTTRNTKTTYEVSSNDSWQYFRFEVTEVAEPNNYLGGYMELLYLGELELNGD